MLCRRRRGLDGGVWSDKYPTRAISLPSKVRLSTRELRPLLRQHTRRDQPRQSASVDRCGWSDMYSRVFGIRCQHCSFRRPPHGCVCHSITYRRTPGTRIGLRCSTHPSGLHERPQDTTPLAMHFDFSTPLSQCKPFSACRTIARSPSFATHALALCFTHSKFEIICSKPSTRIRLENNHRRSRYLSTRSPMK